MVDRAMHKPCQSLACLETKFFCTKNYTQNMHKPCVSHAHYFLTPKPYIGHANHAYFSARYNWVAQNAAYSPQYYILNTYLNS